jgi:hypothetical protein
MGQGRDIIRATGRDHYSLCVTWWDRWLGSGDQVARSRTVSAESLGSVGAKHPACASGQ